MRIILPSAGPPVLQAISGYDQVVTSMSTADVGNGIEDIRGHSHIRMGIVNNTVANSRIVRRLNTGETFGAMWDAPMAVNFRFHEFLLDAEGHVGVCIGEWPTVAPPATNARTATSIRRVQYIAERDGAGTIRHFLVSCDGAARTEIIIAAPSTNDKLSLLWRTNPRAFEVYRNGAMIARMITTLPALGDAGQFIAGYSVWKVPASAVRNHLRMFAFGVMVGQQAI